VNAVANAIFLANSCGANVGATSLLLWNSNTAVQTITLANSEGSFTFSLPPSAVVILQKNASDTLQCSSNAANGFIYANPISKGP
jgi:hypothetical protein